MKRSAQVCILALIWFGAAKAGAWAAPQTASVPQTASAQQMQTASAPQSACSYYPFTSGEFSFGATYWMTEPNCRTLDHSYHADVTTSEGKHGSSDMFSEVFTDGTARSLFQSVGVFKPTGWSIDAEKTLNDRAALTRGIARMLSPKNPDALSGLVHAHYTRITVDGLPGAEIAATFSSESRVKFLMAYIVQDQRRNLAYTAIFVLDDKPGSTHAFDGLDLAFQFLDSFHVEP